MLYFQPTLKGIVDGEASMPLRIVGQGWLASSGSRALSQRAASEAPSSASSP
jgi:hypothetical protein